MPTDTNETRQSGAVAEVKEKGAELASSAQEQVSAKAQELGEEAAFQVREQLDQRSTQAGVQVQATSMALQSGVEQLRADGLDVPAQVIELAAHRADELGGYLKSAQADQILDDLESFARRRPWVTAGLGVLAGFVASRFVKASAERRYESYQRNGRSYVPPTPRGLPSGGA